MAQSNSCSEEAQIEFPLQFRQNRSIASRGENSKVSPEQLTDPILICNDRSVHHKHIVLLFGVTQKPETNEMLLVMEYMRHGSLSRLLFVDKVVLAMPTIIRIALDVANGVDFLHHLTPKIIHRDLKSENVLVSHHPLITSLLT